MIRDISFICLRICGQVFGSIVDTLFYSTYTLRVLKLNVIWEPLLRFWISKIVFGERRAVLDIIIEVDEEKVYFKKDTRTLLMDEIDQIETIDNKDKLKSLIRDIYVESWNK